MEKPIAYAAICTFIPRSIRPKTTCRWSRDFRRHDFVRFNGIPLAVALLAMGIGALIVQIADDDAEENLSGAQSGTEACSTCEPPPECKDLEDKAQKGGTKSSNGIRNCVRISIIFIAIITINGRPILTTEVGLGTSSNCRGGSVVYATF